MLTKSVDGEIIPLSKEEERKLRMKWHLHDSYPLYRDSIQFDGVSEPEIDISRAYEIHCEILNKACDLEINTLNNRIQVAEEEQVNSLRIYLINERKKIRQIKSTSVPHQKTLDDLISSIPEEIAHHWQV